MLTIAALKAARTSEPAVGTIFAKIVKGIRHVDGDQLTIEDFSGSLDVWVPRALHDRGTGVNKWFAFDVVAEAEPCSVIDLSGRSKEVTNAALSSDPETAGHVAAEFISAVQGAARPIVVSAQHGSKET